VHLFNSPASITCSIAHVILLFFFFQAEDGIRDRNVTGVQTCALPIFPILDDKKKLLPYFLLVRNGDDCESQNVIEGNKKVLVARLEDAKFFYDIDAASKLEYYVKDLDNLVFFEGLGNMGQKTERLMELSIRYQKELNLGEDIAEDAKRAAYLAKADLVTKMVVEFTELQGTMGAIYALNS